jgi:hypothetical protein
MTTTIANTYGDGRDVVLFENTTVIGDDQSIKHSFSNAAKR